MVFACCDYEVFLSEEENYPIYLPFTIWYTRARPSSVIGLLESHHKSTYLLDYIYKRMCEINSISTL